MTRTEEQMTDPAPAHVAAPATASSTTSSPAAPVIDVRDLRVFYGASEALTGITLSIAPRAVTAFIGPSGCGKSTLLRCFNRMNDLVPGVRITGEILVEGQDVNRPGVVVEALRKRVGMVFQKSNPFPKSIFENIAYGPRINGIRDRDRLATIVEDSLKKADLWKEVSHRLHTSALALSGGQQQRVCIARTLANDPDIILMDEPASALDPISTAKIEETIHALKERYTIVIVTHNLQQAARVSSHTAFLYMGKLVEIDRTEVIFQNPKMKETEDYVTGKFG